jgi:tetratricopeptide (TPR) repeat protein
MLAYVFDQTAEHDKARDEWTRALEIDPKSEQALEGLSGELLGEKDYIGVVKLLQSAARNEKLDIDLAQALGLLNHLDDAKAVLADGLSENPNSVGLASAMTVVLVKQLRYQEAINLLQHTVDANPGSQEAEVELFRLLVLTNHINQARPMAPKLLAERPGDPQVLYLAGIVERTMGDYTAAKAHLEQAVSLEPDFFNSRYNLGMVLVFLKEWQAAAVELNKAIELGAIEPQVHFELAKAYHGLGQDDKAGEQMKQYQELKKSEEAGLEAAESAGQGDKDLAAGDVKEAIVHYREACDAAPDNADYKFQLSIALHKAGDTDGERAALEQAVKLNPDLAGAQRELGYLLSRSGDRAEAIQHFRMAVKAQPEWTEAWINLAAALAEAGQFAEAREAAGTALKLEPANAQARELSDELARDPAASHQNP